MPEGDCNHDPLPSGADVLIVGGGPVGLLLANLVGQAGKSVIVLDANHHPVGRSMAIGITPPSLDILKSIGLDETFLQRGVKICQAVVHENGYEVGRLRISDWPDPYHFILSLPQVETMKLLRNHVSQHGQVKIMTGWCVVSIEQNDDRVRIVARHAQKGVEHHVEAPLLAACDGARSTMAERLGISKKVTSYAPSFIMGDFIDHSDLGYEAHVYFGSERPVESFPLPGGRRRWIVRDGWRGRLDLQASLCNTVGRLTGIALSEKDQIDESRFQPERKLAATFYRGRVALCGDAAHVMSPIGGQGMNTGFGDAAVLAQAFVRILDQQESVVFWLKLYDSNRRSAFRLASARAAMGMKLGVASGHVPSSLRRVFLSSLLKYSWSQHGATRWFTMRSLPHPLHQLDAITTRMPA